MSLLTDEIAREERRKKYNDKMMLKIKKIF